MTSNRAGDALDGPADAARPSNPWPRILAFFLAVAVAVGLAGVCVASFASPPAREVRVPIENLQPGVPVFNPVTTFGSDRQQRTYGVWTATDSNGRTVALLSRSASSTCHIRWDATAKAGAATGAYVDPCGAGRWSLDGSVLDASATKDMDEFRVRREDADAVIEITRVLLGTCRTESTMGCSREGSPLERAVPKGALPPDFATK
jgi:hypothetical protein